MSIWLKGDDEKRKIRVRNEVPVRIEDGPTWWLAGYWLIEDWGEILAVLERRVERGYGDDRAGCLHAGRWPNIPRKANACRDITDESKLLRRVSTYHHAPRRPQS